MNLSGKISTPLGIGLTVAAVPILITGYALANSKIKSINEEEQKFLDDILKLSYITGFKTSESYKLDEKNYSEIYKATYESGSVTQFMEKNQNMTSEEKNRKIYKLMGVILDCKCFPSDDMTMIYLEKVRAYYMKGFADAYIKSFDIFQTYNSNLYYSNYNEFCSSIKKKRRKYLIKKYLIVRKICCTAGVITSVIGLYGAVRYGNSKYG